MDPYLGPPPDGDASRAGELWGASLSTVSIVSVLVLTRFFTRVFIMKKLSWDDGTMLLAFAFSWLHTVFNCLQIQSGGGRHEYYLTPEQRLGIRTWRDPNEIINFTVIVLTKISLVLFVSRIPSKRNLVRFLWGLMIVLVLMLVSFDIAWLTSCRPIQKMWNYGLPGTCIPAHAAAEMFYVSAAFNLLTDLVCSFLPIWILRGVCIPLRRKIAICGLMSLGLLTCACLVVRVVLTYNFNELTDWSWKYKTIEVWRVLEMNIGLIAANLPVMLPFYKFVREQAPKLYSKTIGHFHGSRFPLLSATSPKPTSVGSRARGTRGKYAHDRWYKMSDDFGSKTSNASSGDSSQRNGQGV